MTSNQSTKSLLNYGLVGSFTILSLGLTLFCAGAHAGSDDEQGKALYEQAISKYDERSATDTAPTDLVIEKMTQALKLNIQDSDLKFSVLILKCKGLYWKALHSKIKSEKVDLFQAAVTTGENAIKVDDGYAEGYYYAGISLGRWGEAVGVAQALFKAPTLVRYMKQAKEHDTQSGDSGDQYDGYGADRVLGHLWREVPAFAGGGHSKSLDHLEKAYAEAPDHVLNGVYLAITLNDGHPNEKIRAKQILKAYVNKDPAVLAPDRIPETIDELELVDELLATWK